MPDPEPAAPRARLGIAIALFVLGVVLLASGALEFWVGVKAEAVADRVRDELSDDGLAQHRADYETAESVFVTMDDKVLPEAATRAGVDERQLRGLVAIGYPSVAQLMNEREELLPFARAGLENLEAQQERFQRADSLLVPGLPGWAGAVFTLLLAAMLLSSGGLVLARQEGAGLAAAGTVAILLVVAPLALGVPGKSGDAQTALDSLDPSAETVARTLDALETAKSGWEELDTRLLPDLASVAGTDRAGLDALMAAEYPGLGDGLAAMPGIVERYERRADIRADTAADLRDLKSIPIGMLGWFGPAFGAVLGAVVIGGGVVSGRRTAGDEQTPAEGPAS